MDRCDEKLWEEFSRPLRSFIRRRVGQEQDAEDILQDVFCKILGGLDGLKDSQKIHAWVYQIARHTIADFYRRQGRESQILELSEDAWEEMEPETGVEQEIALCVRAMIDVLPDHYRQAILLTEFHHLTQVELAAQLGLSLPGAKSRVQRARAKLKDMLLACCHVELDRQGRVIDFEHKAKNCRFC